jgi:eukaryotic-like serine/threonine-protein kinase
MVGLAGEMTAQGPLGRYRRVLLLGQGGTADVHLAVADGPGGFRKLVVLKVLKAGLSHDPELRGMFLNEARLAARLHHPNAVQTYEVLDDDGGPVIVMEYLDGQPLSNLIVQGRGAGLTLAHQVRILVDALAGLHAAHDLQDFDGTPLGVVHRDVSPQNIFVTVDGQVKVLDFGIAKLDRSLVETEVGTVKGKIRYMAPEQLRGDVLDRRADVYAAGVILWEALAGERMWKGIGEGEIRARVQAGDLPPPPSAAGPISEALVRVCRRALALDPCARPLTALGMADELEAALVELPGRGGTRRDLGALVARLFAESRQRTRALVEERIGQLQVELTRTTGEISPLSGSLEISTASAPPPRGRRLTATAIASLLLTAGALVAWRAARPRAPSAPPATVAAPTPAVRTEPTPVLAPVAVEPAARAAVAGPRPDNSAAKHPARVTAPVTAPPATPPPAPDCTHPFFVDGDGIKKFRPECM